ncbi:MAG TPA: Druantia anti-phage system protein DruA, partial [Verrucomicrobiales bacterium]|nr:Druantia anti-phage system protein DruA [Verrucomicrobiales bacterium]
ADGRWVGLLAFSGAAPHLKGREKWIGWSPRQRARRLALVVNNSRFLLLVERERHPKLGLQGAGAGLTQAFPYNVSDTK